MKKLIIGLLLISATISAQNVKTLSDAIIKGYIFSIEAKGLTKIYNDKNEIIHKDYVITNTIEIGGHIIKDPIFFKANLDGINIYDSKKEYQKRKCNVDNCKTIHLEPKLNGALLINGWTTANKTLLLN